MQTQRIVESDIIAHRGASHYAPENTIAAIELAHEMGAEWVEVDVALTRDQELVILHDDTVDRTTDGTGRIADLTLSQVRDLDAGEWFSEKYSGERVPTLDELLDAVLDLGLKLQLELKPSVGTDEELLTHLALNHFVTRWPATGWNNTFITSFSEACMRLSAKKLPHVARAVAIEGIPQDPLGLLAAADAQILHVLDVGAPIEEYKKLATHKLEFAVAIINDAERARELLAAGCQTLLTDKPDLLQ